MAFIDEVTLTLAAGNGGDGVVRWKQEKFRPMGGPGGGDGGNGGDVYAQTIDDLSYLEYYRFKKEFSAQKGEDGGGNNKEGANGEDITVRFPRGTVLTNTETGESIELKEIGDTICLLKGGRGGLGNDHFKSSTNTTPYEWTPGKLGEKAEFLVELKLFADAGFVGLPSAGKSTLLNILTNAKSKVGEYHFTTLEPHLGALGPYVLADIPGLIEGASEGKGLGYKFLKHLTRTKMLVHVIGLDNEDPINSYKEIRHELEAYDTKLAEKQEIILFTKTDLLDEQELKKSIAAFKKEIGPETKIYSLTAYDEDTIKAFKEVLIGYLEKQAQQKTHD
jgi:GTP-binding protein